GPVDDRLVEKITFRESAPRLRLGADVQCRAKKELEGDRGAIFQLCALTDRGSKSGARGIATHRDTICSKSENRGLLKHLRDRGVAVLKRSGKSMFGSKPVLNREHTTQACVGQHPAQPIVRLDASEDASATVKINETRQLFVNTC